MKAGLEKTASAGRTDYSRR